MKKILIALAVAISAQVSRADGFVCMSQDGRLSVKAYDHRDPNVGTRSGAVLVLSDNTVQYGRRTIARFSSDTGTLISGANSFLAKVDLRYRDSSRTGELIAGTKLGYLSRIRLDLNFTYGDNLADSSLLLGRLSLLKRDRTSIIVPLVCKRYLVGR